MQQNDSLVNWLGTDIHSLDFKIVRANVREPGHAGSIVSVRQMHHP